MITARGMTFANDFTATLPKMRRFAWGLSIGTVFVTITLQFVAPWLVVWSSGTRSFINTEIHLFQWTDFIGLPLILAYGIWSWRRWRTARRVPYIFDQLRSPTDELLPPIKVTLPSPAPLPLERSFLTTGFHWEAVAPCESQFKFILVVCAWVMISCGRSLSLLNPDTISNIDIASYRYQLIVLMFNVLFDLVTFGLWAYSFYFIVRIIPRTQKTVVAIASDGLWIHNGRGRLISWDEITTVGIKLSLRSSPDHITFGTHCVIAARSAFLWWSIPMTLTDEDPDVSQYPSLESLAQILKVTGLPLRNMASLSLFDSGSPASRGQITYPDLPSSHRTPAIAWIGVRRYVYIMVGGVIGCVMITAPILYLMTQVIPR